MKKLLLVGLFLSVLHFVNAQSISLIQDANPGAANSVHGMSAELNDNIYYIGFKAGQFGFQLFKYDSAAGTVQSVSSVFNTFSNLLVASTDNIYVSDGNRLNRFDTENNSLVPIFENSSPSDDFEEVKAKDETIVALSKTFDGNWSIFLINELTNIAVKVTETPIDEKITATIGNDYVAIRAFGTFADEEKGNLLIEKSTGTELDPSEVIEDSPCSDFINMLAIGDYILYDCNDGNRYIYSVSQKSSYELSGFANDVRENDNYVFIHSGQNLYSYHKITNEVLNLESGIAHIGEVNDLDGTLYFLRSFDDKLYSTDGIPDNTRVYDIAGEVKPSSQILGVLNFDDTPVVAYNEGFGDFWILKVMEEETESINEFIELNIDFLPFYKIDNNLVFSYDNPDFGEELFKAEFESTATEEDYTQLEEIELFPNPANELLVIKSEYNITASRAIDMQGRSFPLDLSNENTININALYPGIYTLLLISDDTNSVLVQQFQKL